MNDTTPTVRSIYQKLHAANGAHPRPLGQLQSPQGQAAFQTYIPSVMRRHREAVNVMALGIRDVRLLPPSYTWAGTTCKDTFYGTSGKPQRPSGTTGGDTMANYYDCEETR